MTKSKFRGVALGLFCGSLLLLGMPLHAHATTCTVNSGTPQWVNVVADCSPSADPTGTNDSSAAFQAAFAAVGAGGTVYCPVGYYLIGTGITVNNEDAVRLKGDGGQSWNEADSPSLNSRGCTLLANTSGMSLLTFDNTSGSADNHGPILEHVNFRDYASINTSTLLTIENYADWTARNVSVDYANVGLLVEGTSSSLASYGYISQMLCYSSTTCITQVNPASFVVYGGSFAPAGSTGVAINIPGSGARIIGAAFQCLNSSGTGVSISGAAGVVEGSSFTGCATGVQITYNSGGISGSGSNNRVIGNMFTVSGSGNSGINIGSGASSTQVIGNTYATSSSAVSVIDSSSPTTTTRYEAGFGANLNCSSTETVNDAVVQQGIIVSGACAAP